jgi:hypothetical protein
MTLCSASLGEIRDVVADGRYIKRDGYGGLVSSCHVARVVVAKTGPSDIASRHMLHQCFQPVVYVVAEVSATLTDNR